MQFYYKNAVLQKIYENELPFAVLIPFLGPRGQESWNILMFFCVILKMFHTNLKRIGHIPQEFSRRG
jgi:hypothetical protein